MNNRLKHKVIVISGGCGDLGAATAARLAEEGARVVLLDLWQLPRGQEFARKVGAVAYYRCDQADRTAIDPVLAAIHGESGRLDVVIANAGTVRRASFLDIEAADWDAQIRLNLTGCFHLAQAAARLMVRQAPDAAGVRGKVLFTGSWVGRHPVPGGAGYIASKAGLEGLMRALAQELAASGVRANVLAPGLVHAGLTRQVCEATPGMRESMEAMVPLGQLGTPEQVAAGFAFLCSSDADYMTGQTLTIDGGCSVVRRELPVENLAPPPVGPAHAPAG